MVDSDDQQDRGISADAKAIMAFEAAKKSTGVSYLLWLFLGGIGAHRFYLGRTGSGAVMVAVVVLSLVGSIFTFFFAGFIGLIVIGTWWIVDAFLIPGIAREHNEALMQRIDAAMKA